MTDQEPQSVQPQPKQVSLDDYEEMVRKGKPGQREIPKALWDGMRTQESGGDVNATSATGVKGRFQVTKATAAQYGYNRDDPFEQAAAAGTHLRNLFDSSPGQDDHAKWWASVARYYGGDGAVDKDGNLSSRSVDGVSNPIQHIDRVRKYVEQYHAQNQPEQPPQPAKVYDPGYGPWPETNAKGKPYMPLSPEMAAWQAEGQTNTDREMAAQAANVTEKPAGIAPRPRNQRAAQAAQAIAQINQAKQAAQNLFAQADQTQNIPTGQGVDDATALRQRAEYALERANELGRQHAKRFPDLIEVGFGNDTDPSGKMPNGQPRQWVYAKPKAGTDATYEQTRQQLSGAQNARRQVESRQRQQRPISPLEGIDTANYTPEQRRALGELDRFAQRSAPGKAAEIIGHGLLQGAESAGQTFGALSQNPVTTAYNLATTGKPAGNLISPAAQRAMAEQQAGQDATLPNIAPIGRGITSAATQLPAYMLLPESKAAQMLAGGAMTATQQDWRDPGRAALNTGIGAVAGPVGASIGSSVGAPIVNRLASPVARAAAEGSAQLIGGAAGNAIPSAVEQLVYDGKIDPQKLAHSAVIGAAQAIPGLRGPGRIRQQMDQTNVAQMAGQAQDRPGAGGTTITALPGAEGKSSTAYEAIMRQAAMREARQQAMQAVAMGRATPEELALLESLKPNDAPPIPPRPERPIQQRQQEIQQRPTPEETALQREADIHAKAAEVAVREADIPRQQEEARIAKLEDINQKFTPKIESEELGQKFDREQAAIRQQQIEQKAAEREQKLQLSQDIEIQARQQRNRALLTQRDIAETARDAADNAIARGDHETALEQLARHKKALMDLRTAVKPVNTGGVKLRDDLTVKINQASDDLKSINAQVRAMARAKTAPLPGATVNDSAPAPLLRPDAQINPEGGIPKLPENSVNFARLAEKQNAQQAEAPAERGPANTEDLTVAGLIKRRLGGFRVSDRGEARVLGGREGNALVGLVSKDSPHGTEEVAHVLHEQGRALDDGRPFVEDGRVVATEGDVLDYMRAHGKEKVGGTNALNDRLAQEEADYYANRSPTEPLVDERNNIPENSQSAKLYETPQDVHDTKNAQPLKEEPAPYRTPEQQRIVDRRAAEREASLKGNFGKFGEAARKSNEGERTPLARHPELRELLDLPPIPDRETDAALHDAEMQHTLNALAELGGKPRSSEMDYDTLRGVWRRLAVKAARKGTPISDDLKQSFKGTVGDLLKSQDRFGRFVTDEGVQDALIYLDNAYGEQREPTRREVAAIKSSVIAAAKQYGIAPSFAESWWKQAKAEAETRTQSDADRAVTKDRARSDRSDGQRGLRPAGSGISEAERATGTFGRAEIAPQSNAEPAGPSSRAGLRRAEGGRAAVQEEVKPQWQARIEAADKRIAESKTSGRYEHLDQVPWGVEYLRGKTITSLRDGSTGVIKTVTNRGDAIVRWKDAASAERNSAEPSEARTGPRSKKTQTVWENTLLKPDRGDFVLADQSRVLADHPDLQSKAAEPRTVSHDNPAIDGKPIIAETKDGRVIVPNDANQSGVSVVKDQSKPAISPAPAKRGEIQRGETAGVINSGDVVTWKDSKGEQSGTVDVVRSGYATIKKPDGTNEVISVRRLASERKSGFSVGKLPDESSGPVLGVGLGGFQNAFGKKKASTPEKPEEPVRRTPSRPASIADLRAIGNPRLQQSQAAMSSAGLSPESPKSSGRNSQPKTADDYFKEQMAKSPVDPKVDRMGDRVKEEAKKAAQNAADRVKLGKMTQEHADNIKTAVDALLVAGRLNDASAIRQARKDLHVAQEAASGSIGRKLKQAARVGLHPISSVQTAVFGTDFSYVGRQAAPLTFNPLNVFNTARAFKLLYNATGREEATGGTILPKVKGAEYVRQQLESHPRYDLANRAGLELALTSHPEEIYQNNIVSKLPWVKRMEAGNEAFLDYMRLQEFGKYADAIDATSQTQAQKDAGYRRGAAIVNDLTGRADLGQGKLKAMADATNGIFSSPRLNISHIKLLDPTRIARELYHNPAVGQRMLKDATAMMSTMGGMMALGNYTGIWSVGLNPDDSDFLKFKIGNTRYDPGFGELPLIRLFFKVGKTAYKMEEDARLGTAQSEKELKAAAKESIRALGSWGEGRLGPLPSYVWNLWKGQDFLGRPVKLSQFAHPSDPNSPYRRLLVPASAGNIGSSIMTGVKDGFGKGAAEFVKTVPTELFGIGTNTYEKTKKPAKGAASDMFSPSGGKSRGSKKDMFAP